MFKFFDKDQQKDIEVTPERWRWITHFEDHTILCQFDPGEERYHQFQDIKETGKTATSFQMVSDHNPQGFNLLVPEGADLIHYYRTQVLDYMGTPQKVRLYCFGWKILIDGRSHKRILVIHPDDSIEISDDDGRVDY